MLELFHSIFGTERGEPPYPDELIRRAVERAVDATDPRLRALPGYQKKLRAAVRHAIDHVVSLVDRLPAPLELGRDRFAADPELVAYFASAAHAQEVLALDPELNRWRSAPEHAATEHIIGLLVMEEQERHTFGVALEGEMLRRDVPQTTVSFAEHRLVDPAGTEADTRRLLKRRAFDHLLALALGRITAAHAERDELERERHLLQRKQKALASGRWGFDTVRGAAPADPQALQRQLADIESQLQALGAGPGLLTKHLELVAEVLAQAERNLWGTRTPLVVDRMGIKQTRASALAPQLELAVVHNAAGRSLVVRLVGIARAELPPPRDMLREAQRYLG